MRVIDMGQRLRVSTGMIHRLVIFLIVHALNIVHRRASMSAPRPSQIWLVAHLLLLWPMTLAQPIVAIAETTEVIQLVTITNSAEAFISEAIVRRAYARIGYPVEVTRYPAERAITFANNGHADGEVHRINGLGKVYPNLIQVYPAINYFEGSAFSVDRDLPVDGWESLQSYRIGLIRGIKFSEVNTVGMDRYFTGDYATLFKMLQKNRFDVAISPLINGIYQLKRQGINSITPVGPPLERFDVYHYVHRDHADLVPKLEIVFRDMLESGELIAIREQVVVELLRRAEQGLPLCDDKDQCFEPSPERG